ncbi:cilia- and flagella-associated protein 45-like [Tautogolabrus adspersus]
MRLGFSREDPKNLAGSGARRYRTVAPTAQVDEPLFGNNIMLNKRGKTNPSEEFTILSPSECQRIRSASQFTAKDEKKAYQRTREEEYKAGEVMRRRIIDIENIRQQNMPPSQKELKAREHSKKMRERANTLRMMQEDEVKELNTVFLAVQCQETREAQIAEKRWSQAELAKEEKLLNAWREMERLKALEAIEQADELHKQKQKRLLNHNHNQILQNIQNKQVLNEMERQEGQKVQEREEKKKLKHLKTLEQDREKLQRLQKQNEDLIARKMQVKKQRMEEEKLADIKDKEFIQRKMKQEAEQEAARQRKKKERELEIAKLFAQQEKDKDNKAEQDEIHAKRTQEIKDREWRRKEKDEAAKKVQDEARKRTAHYEQLHSKERLQAVEVMRQKEEFDRVLKASQYTNSKHKEEEDKQRKKAANYLEALQHQIKESDQSAATERQKVLKEAQDLIDLGSP